MRDKDQKMRFTKEELGLIKSLFADNEDLLYTVRKAMLQFELTEQEAKAIKAVMNERVYLLMTKTFNPWIDHDAPWFQMTDLVLGLGGDIKTLSPDGAWPFIKAKQIEIEYIDQQLKVLQGSDDEPKIVLSELADLSGEEADGERIYINVTARNYLLSFIDSNCNQLKILAGQKDETVDETIEKLRKDSNK